jgi:hypothetical protein
MRAFIKTERKFNEHILYIGTDGKNIAYVKIKECCR